jgi:N-acetylmuramoyl-L-alanine amidase
MRETRGLRAVTRRGWLAIGSSALLAAAVLGLGFFLSRPVAGREAPPGARPLPPELFPLAPLSGQVTIAIQPGHWQVADLPDELWRLRESTGASYAGVKEVEVNRGVATALAALVEARGWKAVVVPSTIPPGLRADAFVAIHADWGASPAIRGWKIAPPWRASPASRRLAAELASSFAAEPGRVEDAEGITIQMRGYFAFSYRRFEHALSPFTPAAIVELGFITNQEERTRLRDDPGYWARILMRGLEGFVAASDRSDVDALRPVVYPWVEAWPARTTARSRPDTASAALWAIEPGSPMLPVDSTALWYEVFVPRRRQTAWVQKAEVAPTMAPARTFRFPEPADK